MLMLCDGITTVPVGFTVKASTIRVINRLRIMNLCSSFTWFGRHDNPPTLPAISCKVIISSLASMTGRRGGGHASLSNIQLSCFNWSIVSELTSSVPLHVGYRRNIQIQVEATFTWDGHMLAKRWALPFIEPTAPRQPQASL